MHNRVRVEPEGQPTVERLARSIMPIPEHHLVDAILKHIAKTEARSRRGPLGAATHPATS